MDKKTRLIILLAGVILLSVIYIGWEVRQNNTLKTELLTEACGEIDTINSRLDEALANPDPESDIWQELSDSFKELYTTLEESEFNWYTGLMDFEVIGDTMTDTQGEVNGTAYYGLLTDGTISENEISYLEELRSDMGTLQEALETDGQANTELSAEQINTALTAFFDNRESGNDYSTYRLLENGAA